MLIERREVLGMPRSYTRMCPLAVQRILSIKTLARMIMALPLHGLPLTQRAAQDCCRQVMRNHWLIVFIRSVHSLRPQVRQKLRTVLTVRFSSFFCPPVLDRIHIYNPAIKTAADADADADADAIDVNYVNVNAFYFYFTPILVEIDVKDNFYVLTCSYSQKGWSSTCQTFHVYWLGNSCNFHSPCSRVYLRLCEKFPSAHGCTYWLYEKFASQ